jgi:hypothetical protein
MNSVSAWCLVTPELQAELALEIERHVETSRDAGRARLLEEVLGRLVRVQRDLVPLQTQRVRSEQAGLPGPDDRDLPY